MGAVIVGKYHLYKRKYSPKSGREYFYWWFWWNENKPPPAEPARNCATPKNTSRSSCAPMSSRRNKRR